MSIEPIVEILIKLIDELPAEVWRSLPIVTQKKIMDIAIPAMECKNKENEK